MKIYLDSPIVSCILVPMEDDFVSCGWPGDGSGEDDLADYNANEADDYRNEGENLDQEPSYEDPDTE
jgi:hypothetical protein